MDKIKKGMLLLTVFATVIIVSGYTKTADTDKKNETTAKLYNKQHSTINMFVTHGHCSTPFTGVVDDLKVDYPIRLDLGNPLENMHISFEVNPNSFRVCRGDKDDLTARIKTPGVFVGENDERITFKSTNVYTMGIDWYQVNGIMSIKGVEKEMKLFATGIRNPKEQVASSLVLEGQVNLFDWGIDYDKIVNGKSDTVPTKLLYINMKVELETLF